MSKEGYTTDCSWSFLALLPGTNGKGKAIAENKLILSQQYYHYKGKKIDLKDDIKHMQKGTVMYGGDFENQYEEELASVTPTSTTSQQQQASSSAATTVAIEESTVAPQQTLVTSSTFNTVIKVVHEDCVEVAYKLLQQGSSPLLLNLAQRHAHHVAGKYYFPYAGSQEEYIERRSGVYRAALDPFQNPILLEQLKKKNPKFQYHVPEFGCVYVPRVPIIRNDKYVLQEAPFHVDVVACGAIDLRHFGVVMQYIWREGRELEDWKYKDKQGNLDLAKFRKHTANKIRMILVTAIKTKHVDLVLGALGCGAFLNDPKIVAKIFHEVLEEPVFKNRFRTIYFAILGAANFEPFRDEFK